MLHACVIACVNMVQQRACLLAGQDELERAHQRRLPAGRVCGVVLHAASIVSFSQPWQPLHSFNAAVWMWVVQCGHAPCQEAHRLRPQHAQSATQAAGGLC
jgi:hypothetical protein